MNQKYFIEKIKKECSFLEQERFEFKYEDKSISYKKNNENGYCIEFNWAEYDYLLISNLTASIRFQEIEIPLSNILGTKFENSYSIWTGLKELNIKIRTVKDIFYFVDVVKEFYNKTFLSFCEKFNNIERVYEFYSTLKRDDIGHILTNSGNSIFYRELILNSKLGESKAKNYYDMIINELAPLKSNPIYENIINNLRVIYKSLGYTV